MKKIFILSALLLTVSLNAQDFPGENVELLEGKELKVLPIEDEYEKKGGYRGFYTNEKRTNNYKRKGLYSSIKSLEGKIFKVVSYKPSTYGNYLLTLHNDETGTLYFDYNPKLADFYHFEAIGGLDYPENFFCERMKSQGGEYKFNYNYTDVSRTAVGDYTPKIEDIQFRYWPTQTQKYDIDIVMVKAGDKREPNLQGVIIYLENGKEVAFPEKKISIETSGSGYKYNAIVHPTEEQIALMKESKITRVSFGPFEKTYRSSHILREYVKCFGKK